MKRYDIKSISLEEIQALLTDMKEAPFRGKQIFSWLHGKQCTRFDEMTNLSKALQAKLDEKAVILNAKQVKKLVSQVDGTIKYLFELGNGSIIESVLMRYGYGNTVCISTQAGCRMGCTFCASTLDGVERNLTASEMLSQVYEIQKDIGERISGVVLMGSGEPLDNYENVLNFIRLINHPMGLQIGQRHITLSTCGLVEKMYQLAEENLQITLAVSLHAPNDSIRNQIMPISKKYSMEELLAACRAYIEKTNRRITFEYALIQGVNDTEDCAKELSTKLRHMLCHVNLIPVNSVKERNYIKSSQERVEKFAAILQQHGVETTIRRKLGSDIHAACGQLRRGYAKPKPEIT
ncbi:MAG: 23S rRNA (adenine(2503)-C(2))-methyltransferase RlmN [Epulopiscium sp.]|jgi:23S rRNA (adenine2503-C2)-methyltransferase|nr:23S rRNA (adenine(2503)-C(2))-methyltransferase RlmN [Candidatus Epulonipiscium sp.]